MRFLWQAAAALVGLSLGSGMGLLAVFGLWAQALFAVALLVALGTGAWRVGGAERRPLLVLAGAAFCLRLATLATLHTTLVASGRAHGFVFQDDLAFASFAERLMRTVFRGETGLIVHDLDFHLYGSYSYLSAVVFLVFGPDTSTMKVLNAALIVASSFLLFDLARRLLGARPALVATTLYLFYPAIFLWSVLNLKDALALFLILLVIWSVATVAQTGGPRRAALAYVALAPLESVRLYLFLILALLAPVSLFVRLRSPLGERLRWTGLAALGSAALLLLSSQGLLGNYGFRPLTFEQLAQQSALSAAGARTAFVDPRPEQVVTVQPEQALIILPAPTSAPAASTETSDPGKPASLCRVITVAPGTAIMVAAEPERAKATPSSRPDVVYVRPGDIVLVSPTPGGCETTEAATAEPLMLSPCELARLELAGPDSGRELRALQRILEGLPRGLLYTLLAPFPWRIETSLDVLAAPQMLLWYGLLPAAAFAAWRERRRWREWLLPAGYLACAVLIFAIGEGNVGTLFRHRAMIEPVVFLFASGGLAALFARAMR